MRVSAGEQIQEKLNSDILAEWLADSGVSTVFGITGAGNLQLFDSIAMRGLKVVFSHHEQASVMSAIGYARVTGQVAVVLVTTGGGAANAVIGALSAHLDSVPVVIVAGNESSQNIQRMAGMRAVGVQGFDSVAVFEPITKSSIRFDGRDSIEDILSMCFEIAASDRPGPVFLEFPMDLQRQVGVSSSSKVPGELLRGRSRSLDSSWRGEKLAQLCSELSEARRPLLYLGEGLRKGEGLGKILNVARSCQIPILLSWSAIDFLDDSDELLLGRAGIYGDRFSNIAIQNADFLLAVGTRLSIPQVGYDRNDFARKAKRWVVDIDNTELSKFDSDKWNLVNADCGIFAEEFERKVLRESSPLMAEGWAQSLSKLKELLPRSEQIDSRVGEGFLHSFDFVDCLSDTLPRDSIIVTDVGAALLTTHYALRVKDGQRVFTSQGLGEMGFCLPASIGAQFASPGSLVFALTTDGGLMFNLQELQVVATHQLPIKIVVLNNYGYSSIRISQDNLFGGRRVGSHSEDELGFPDLKSVAATFGLRHQAVNSKSSLEAVLPGLISSGRSELLEVQMDPEQSYLPRLQTRSNSDGALVSPSIEFLEPEIEQKRLNEILESCDLGPLPNRE